MAEAGGGPISVIARHMQLIRDDFISELFDKMKAEIRGLDYDARMADLWRASITENFVTAVHYLDRDTPQSLVEAPAAALAYAQPRRSVIFCCPGWFGRTGSGMRVSWRWRCSTCRCWSPLTGCRRSSSW